MQIQPLGNTIQLEIDQVSAGALDLSSRESAVEYAKVVAISNEVSSFVDSVEIGDYVFVKAWAIDIISHEGKKYYFCNLDTNGVLAVVK